MSVNHPPSVDRILSLDTVKPSQIRAKRPQCVLNRFNCTLYETLAMADETSTALSELHHVAIPTKDVAATVGWYTKTFSAEVRYQDETWALLKFANIFLAIVTEGQHPMHLGFVVDDAEGWGELKEHRDGTKSLYISDDAGNAVELLADNDALRNL